MLGKDKSTPNNEPTLKDIEEHLKRQDKQYKREAAFAISASGASVGLVGITLQVTTPAPSPAALAMSTLLIVWGFGVVICAWLRSRKIRS